MSVEDRPAWAGAAWFLPGGGAGSPAPWVSPSPLPCAFQGCSSNSDGNSAKGNQKHARPLKAWSFNRHGVKLKVKGQGGCTLCRVSRWKAAEAEKVEELESSTQSTIRVHLNSTTWISKSVVWTCSIHPTQPLTLGYSFGTQFMDLRNLPEAGQYWAIPDSKPYFNCRPNLAYCCFPTTQKWRGSFMGPLVIGSVYKINKC